MERIIYDDNKKRRVRLFSSNDDTFRYIEEHFSDYPNEMCWVPQMHRRSSPICGSFEVLVREAVGRIDWLTEEMFADPTAD